MQWKGKSPFFVWRKVKINWDINMIRISQEGGKATVKQILGWEDKNTSKRTVTARLLSKKVNHLGKVVWDKKNYNRVHKVYKFRQNRLTRPDDGTLKPLKTTALADGNRSMLDQTASKILHKNKGGNQERKRIKTLNEKNPIKNTKRILELYKDKSRAKRSPSFTCNARPSKWLTESFQI